MSGIPKPSPIRFSPEVPNPHYPGGWIGTGGGGVDSRANQGGNAEEPRRNQVVVDTLPNALNKWAAMTLPEWLDQAFTAVVGGGLLYGNGALTLSPAQDATNYGGDPTKAASTIPVDDKGRVDPAGIVWVDVGGSYTPNWTNQDGTLSIDNDTEEINHIGDMVDAIDEFGSPLPFGDSGHTVYFIMWDNDTSDLQKYEATYRHGHLVAFTLVGPYP